jgi:dTDP-4-amino-4,6-dideoxygalactose transaminase
VTLRWLPPVAAPVTLTDIGRGIAGLVRPQRALAATVAELRATLGVEHAWLVSSGRAALTLILQALASRSDRTRVVIPAYTCYSVPAAIVRAGLDVVPCDIDATTLDFAFQDLEARLKEGPVLCVVATHLFGVPADVERTRRLCESHCVVVVEDAAQAFGFKCSERWFGTLGDVSFFSFGRGKTLSTGGGGAIVCDRPDIADAIERKYSQLRPQSALKGLRLLAEVAVTSLLLHPSVYGLPARLPCLGLGETTYSTAFPIGRLGGGQAGLLRRWPDRIARMNKARARAVSALVPLVSCPRVAVQVCLRLPVVCRSREERDGLCRKGVGAELGISPMYPGAVSQIPELRDSLGRTRYPVAESVAERLLTLPVHPLVSDADLQSMARLLSRPDVLRY